MQRKRNKNLFQVLRLLVDSKREKVNSTQDFFNYDKMFPDGVCQIGKNTYNKMIRFSDISYQLSQDEMKQRIFAQYSTLLNGIDSSVELQECFINYRVSEEKNTQEILKHNEGSGEFEKLRNEYLSFVEEQGKKGNNGIIRSKYFVFTIVDKTRKGAVRRLETIESILKENLKTMGSVTESLNGIERLSIVNYFLNSKSKHYIDLENASNEILRSGTSKDMIAPKIIDFGRKNDEFKINKKYGTTMNLSIEATELSDRVLAEYLESDLELIVSIHIRPLEHQKAVRMVKTKTSDLNTIKIDEQKKALRNGYDMDILPSDLNENVKDSQKILKDLQRENEKYFFMTFTVTVLENSPNKLDDAVYTLQSIASKQNCTLQNMKFQQEKALLSALPFGYNTNEKEIERGLTTSSTAIFMPFTTQELYQDDPEATYYGLNVLSNNMIMANRKKLKNPNGLYLGTPGSGKTFACEREIIDTFFTTNDDIIISDPEGEYYYFVKLLNGDVVNISGTSNDYLNPLDITLDYNQGKNPIVLKSEFVLDMMALIVGNREGLTGKEKTLIDKCVTKIYRPFLDNPIPENIPILEDLYNELKAANTEVGNDLADALELYVHGSLNVFNHRTNVNPNNRIICFNIQELGSTLKDLGQLVVQDHVWNTVSRNRNKGKKTWFYMDEFHKLLSDARTSKYSIEFWKRFRKWGGIPTGITQNVKDLLRSPEIETILDNSDFVYLLNQAEGDRHILQTRLGISDYQATYITNSEEGEGLISYAGTILPFKDKFPKNNSLYPVMTSKPEEIKEYKAQGVFEKIADAS